MPRRQPRWPSMGFCFVQFFDAGQQRAQFLELGRAGLGDLEVLDLDQQVFALGQELVQRRIEEADGDREATPWP